jgi:hypothetical protein
MEKKTYGQLLQIKCLKREKVFPHGKGDKMIALAMFFEGVTCPWRKRLSCLGEQLH